MPRSPALAERVHEAWQAVGPVTITTPCREVPLMTPLPPPHTPLHVYGARSLSRVWAFPEPSMDVVNGSQFAVDDLQA